LFVSPGADPGAVKLAFDGAERIQINKDGDLVLVVGTGNVLQHKPIAYQEVNGKRVFIEAHYLLTRRNQIAFRVSQYDNKKPLIVDPVLSYSTYLGGTGEETGYGIAVDSAGSAYVTGYTESSSFPTKNPLGPLPNPSLIGEAFVAKLNPGGNARVYATYLGGADLDQGRAIAVDSASNAYVVGFTSSTNFPTVNAFKPAHPTFEEDGFLTKINATGSGLIYSTYLGGKNIDEARGVAVDPTGSVYVTGFTFSSDFPTANPMQPALLGTEDCFITKFNTAGTALVYSTYVGGAASDAGLGIAVD
jgi:hypothetical protein